MAYFVAESYKNYSYDESKAYQKSGKLYVAATCKCDRCHNGVFVSRVENDVIVPHPAYGGVCLKCGGTGFIRKEIRLYTEKEKAAAVRATARRIEKKEEERVAKVKDLEVKSEEYKREWCEKNGLAPDGSFYCIGGDNTFAIKEFLKEAGCRFNPVLKWYSADPIDVPAGYTVIRFEFKDIFDWSMYSKKALPKLDAAEIIEKAFIDAAGPSLSEYMGEVGDRLRNITAVYMQSRGFEGKFGYTYVHNFKVGENVLVWFTSKGLNIEDGTVVDLTGTIKGHEEYKGVKNTQLSRCIIKPIE